MAPMSTWCWLISKFLKSIIREGHIRFQHFFRPKITRGLRIWRSRDRYSVASHLFRNQTVHSSSFYLFSHQTRLPDSELSGPGFYTRSLCDDLGKSTWWSHCDNGGRLIYSDKYWRGNDNDTKMEAILTGQPETRRKITNWIRQQENVVLVRRF